MKFLGVMVAGLALGGWAVPMGFMLDLSPLMTFVAAASGGLLGCWAFLLAGERFSAFIHRHRGETIETTGTADDQSARQPNRAVDERADSDTGRVRKFVDRFGVRGLGIVGPIFPGVTASVIGGLALGLDRRSLGKWMTIGIFVMYGLYVLGLALLASLV
jgi:membrane protein DedA with SNARE-associated domain